MAGETRREARRRRRRGKEREQRCVYTKQGVGYAPT
jgi:hypothetical protein